MRILYFSINISQVSSKKVRFRGYKLSRVPLFKRFRGYKLSRKLILANRVFQDGGMGVSSECVDSFGSQKMHLPCVDHLLDEAETEAGGLAALYVSCRFSSGVSFPPVIALPKPNRDLRGRILGVANDLRDMFYSIRNKF